MLANLYRVMKDVLYVKGMAKSVSQAITKGVQSVAEVGDGT